MVTAPTNENRYRISRFDLAHYGRYNVRVYHVNQEYANLYYSHQPDSLDLNEPLTNVENGLGIFSAFASSSANFTMAQQA